jgi:hypothetical protein
MTIPWYKQVADGKFHSDSCQANLVIHTDEADNRKHSPKPNKNRNEYRRFNLGTEAQTKKTRAIEKRQKITGYGIFHWDCTTIPAIKNRSSLRKGIW